MAVKGVLHKLSGLRIKPFWIFERRNDMLIWNSWWPEGSYLIDRGFRVSGAGGVGLLVQGAGTTGSGKCQGTSDLPSLRGPFGLAC